MSPRRLWRADCGGFCRLTGCAAFADSLVVRFSRGWSGWGGWRRCSAAASGLVVGGASGAGARARAGASGDGDGCAGPRAVKTRRCG